MFLNYLDSAIGFIVVILLFSLLITVLVQMIAQVLQLRGKTLLKGVSLILEEIAPDLDEKARADLADQALRHPTIAEGAKRLATALRSNELKLVLQSLARDAANRPKLQALVDRGEELQKDIDTWFETVMDRASERFKMNTRWVTAIFAVLLAFVLQIDSIAIYQQISTNPELRAGLVSMSANVEEQANRILTPTTDPASLQAIQALGTQASELKQQLVATRLKLIPDDWCWNPFTEGRKLLGVILSCFLLGMGAPFWYNSLRNLVGLRNVVTQKTEKQQTASQNVTPPATAT